MNKKAIFLVAVTFVLGIALGGLSMHLAADRGWTGHGGSRGPHGKGRVIDQLTRELELSVEQQEKLQGVLQQTRQRYQTVYEQIRPQMEQARMAGRENIRKVLTPEQLPKFEALLRKADEDRKKRETRPDR